MHLLGPVDGESRQNGGGGDGEQSRVCRLAAVVDANGILDGFRDNHPLFRDVLTNKT